MRNIKSQDYEYCQNHAYSRLKPIESKKSESSVLSVTIGDSDKMQQAIDQHLSQLIQ